MSDIPRGPMGEKPHPHKGKTKDGIATAGGAKTAWFKDTEGNTMAVVQSMEGK